MANFQSVSPADPHASLPVAGHVKAGHGTSSGSTDRLHAVAAAASGVISAVSRAELREVLEDACRRALPFDAFFVQGYDADAHAFHGFGGVDAGVESPTNVVPAAGTPGERVVRERRSLLTLQADDPSAQGGHLTGTGRRSESVIRSPIVSGADVLGVLSVHSYTPGLYTEDDVQVVEILAALGATALMNLRLADERRYAEAALADRERELAEARRVARLGSWRWTIGTDDVEWSDEMFRIYGLDSGAGRIAFDTFAERIHPDDRDALFERVEEARTSGEPYEIVHRVVRPDGSVRVLKAHGEVVRGPDGAPIQMFGTGQDVTEARASEEALQRAHEELECRVVERTAELAQRTADLARAEQRFRAIVESSPMPLVLSHVEDGTILYSNDRLDALLGAAPGSLIGRRTVEFYYNPEDRPRIMEAVLEQGFVRDVELMIRRHDGSSRWVSLTVQRLEYDGQPALATVLIDMTERKLAEESVRSSEESYRGLFDNLTELVYVQALDGTFVNVNDAVLRAYGYSKDEMVGQDPSLLAAPGLVDLTAVQESFRLAVDGIPQRFEWWALRKDGSIFPKEVTLKRSTYFGQEVVIAVARDIEDQKRYEEDLEQARREAEAARVRASRYAKSLERELEFGRQIQQGLLPATLPGPSGWEIDVRFHPVWQVAGDFYDAFELPSGRVGLIIADISGKGVGAALFMALFQSLLRATAERVGAEEVSEFTVLTSAVGSTNDYITRVHRHAHMFASVFFGLLDPQRGRLHYVNAGHEKPVLIRAGRAMERLDTTGPALGLLPDATFEVRTAELEPGDVLVAFTDGVTEARSEDRDFFTEERLLSVMQGGAASASDVLDRIETAVHDFSSNASPSDDLTLLAVRRLGYNSALT